MSDGSQPISASELMHGMSVHHLRFTVYTTGDIQFGDQPGSALRGALYQALAQHFCSESFQRVTVDHAERCPVCWLMALEDPSSPRGRDLARPMTIQPPEKTSYHPGETLTFGLSLIGQARSVLPYLARAVEWMGRTGIGKRRGGFVLKAIHEHSPLLDVQRLLMDGSTVRTPTLAVTAGQIAEHAHALPCDRITLHFQTPTRLIADGRLVKLPEPAVLVARLLERCQTLATHYAETDTHFSPEAWRDCAAALVENARGLRVGYSEVEWVEVFSGSRRQGRTTPISGFVGAVRWEGDVKALREWLLWGQSLHVGKDAIKGNGWYRVVV